MNQLIESILSIFRKISFIFRKTDTAEICGHQTKRNPEKVPEFCEDCLRKMAARCAWCGRLIYFGDVVTLYAASQCFRIPDFAIRDEECEGNVLVGCAGCATCKSHYKGIWVPPGVVQKFPIVVSASKLPHHNFRIVIDPTDPKDFGRLVESDSDSTSL